MHFPFETTMDLGNYLRTLNPKTMKFRVVLPFLLAASVWQALGQEKQPVLTDKKDRFGYALGGYIGDFWKRQGLEVNDVNWDLVVKAFKAKIAETPSAMSKVEQNSTMTTLGTELHNRFLGQQKVLSVKNKEAGDRFRAEFEAKPGVKKTPSGLLYKVNEEGSGPSPTTNDLVVLSYKGTFIDGAEFDNSNKYKHNQALPISGTPGWMEALQLMKPGAKWQVVIPPQLAHGERGSYPLIGPNATLVYDIELISVDRGANKNNISIPGGGTNAIIRVPSADEMKKGASIEIIREDQLPKPKAAPSDNK
jgi:FKBP-type peptidyl-prolyl cis-trans isomerase FklB